jgi:dCMP deaminase
MSEVKWDQRFLQMAVLVAGWSKDPSTKCGAVIVAPDRRVISLGFNGFPQRMPDRPELYANRDEKYSRIVHCEMNAVLFARENLRGATLYTWPFLSCDRCAVHMIQVGISRCVAPLPTDDHKRWSSSLAKTRQYFSEAGVEFSEYRVNNITGFSIPEITSGSQLG